MTRALKLYRLYAGTTYDSDIMATSQKDAIARAKRRDGQNYWRYGDGSPITIHARLATRSNPVKTRKRAKAHKASVERRVASALAKFLKQANPAMKTAGARVQRLKGGVIKITPIKANAARKGSLSEDQMQQIRWLYVHEKLTQGQIAKRLGISVKRVTAGLHGRRQR